MKKTILALTAICMLVANGISANEPSLAGSTDVYSVAFEPNTFCKAIMKGDVETVKKLIELGEDVNRKSLGMTPAHFAARYNQPEILKLLIENGANLKKRSDKGYTAKRYAEMSNATQALEVIENAMKK
ncbi:ankyrin repeat domain-containing protein [Flagellimonas nanhaiensis]|uniref:Ankyrin repeat domain-containing protein n=1 Tax=Flagellimonas nanhaiensis TaxID=2292706 RepID=A0A371JM07_9FLAO|nr:ankyrin repeat domain-containing protein [Allomuricauda nanhaiensis]RDY58094.1 ankyrin repeat domain-containing protein [Allomuricauda nanhaiensis]